MSKFKVMAFALCIDGFGAGLGQSLENPLGVGGMALHEWAFPTRAPLGLAAHHLAARDLGAWAQAQPEREVLVGAIALLTKRAGRPWYRGATA